MKTVLIILVFVLLIRYGWKLIKYIWQHPWQTIFIILLGSALLSKEVIDTRLSTGDSLKENGYTQDSEGLKQFIADGISDIRDNKEDYIEGFKELGDSLIVSFIETSNN